MQDVFQRPLLSPFISALLQRFHLKLEKLDSLAASTLFGNHCYSTRASDRQLGFSTFCLVLFISSSVLSSSLVFHPSFLPPLSFHRRLLELSGGLSDANW